MATTKFSPSQNCKTASLENHFKQVFCIAMPTLFVRIYYDSMLFFLPLQLFILSLQRLNADLLNRFSVVKPFIL